MSLRSIFLCATVGFGGLAVGWVLASWYQATPQPNNLQKASPFIPGDHQHPLDPLSPDEIKLAANIIHEQANPPRGIFFPFIALHEPSKPRVLAYQPGDAISREAFVMVLDRVENRVHELIVDLTKEKITAHRHIPDVQAPVIGEEFTHAVALAKADKRFLAAVKRRNISPDDVIGISWAGGFNDRTTKDRINRIPFLYTGKSRNQYARPVEGLVVVVKMNGKKPEVLEVIDRDPVIPVPADTGDFFDPKYIGTQRAVLKPLEIHQPKGVSFEVRGQEIRWDNWRFRIGFHPREGMTLHTVGYQDGKNLRSILYRAGLAELVVFYGDTNRELWSWRNPFDMGEYSFGATVTTQRLGKEAPSNAVLLPVTLHDDRGASSTRAGTIAIFEEANGLLWTHTDYTDSTTTSRLSRQLVVQALHTVGNYGYLVRWIFRQDGSLEAVVEMHGIGQTKAVNAQKCPSCAQKPDDQGRLRSEGEDRYGKLVAPGVVAVNHQHFFCYRLDLDIDGIDNSIEEMNVLSEVASKSPEGNGIVAETLLLRSEKEGQRQVNPNSHRSWRVFNSAKVNALGHYAGYKLVPGGNVIPFARSDSLVRQRAGFLNHHLWVTPNREKEHYPAGDYPNLSKGGEGLPRWTAGNADITNRDIVLWYTVGSTHVYRAESWPVMTASRVGFRLAPDGFFTRNPALDVPE